MNQINWRDRYIVIDKVKAGKTVSVTFPISERTVTEKVGGVVYAFIIKGSTVVSINPLNAEGIDSIYALPPQAKNCPFYQRSHYRENRTLWNKKSVFVPEENIKW